MKNCLDLFGFPQDPKILSRLCGPTPGKKLNRIHKFMVQYLFIDNLKTSHYACQGFTRLFPIADPLSGL
jgi:hypothetical protein